MAAVRSSTCRNSAATTTKAAGMALATITTNAAARSSTSLSSPTLRGREITRGEVLSGGLVQGRAAGLGIDGAMALHTEEAGMVHRIEEAGMGRLIDGVTVLRLVQTGTARLIVTGKKKKERERDNCYQAFREQEQCNTYAYV